ncbi:kynureninase [Erythrobacter arachoides]|uniref:Kynureninase n=1 Tax=Aurantiacibacter arachoides TaxID=1850444 RepID=A0A845A1T4_9SPHN|nr:kynureninase [Aurantiacibacter arachoides]MXO94501.1 kynureninase [Aurantiacibacter arachoides]GGD62941.1 kynureninase [Aurantiacibacter arachoides]
MTDWTHEAARLDAEDPLAKWRAEFLLDEGVAYLDGNSLGALPRATPERLQRAIRQEWGEGLIGSWNGAGWIGLPQKIGGMIAPLIGAQAHEVIAADSVSVNLFKLIGAALQMRPGRKVVLSEPGNFPTDLYMIAGQEAQGLAERRLADRSDIGSALDDDVALLLLTHVHYKTGAMYDMAALTKAAHATGALVLWDLSHSVGAVPVDLNGVGADFAVGCGYKYLNGGPGAPAFAWVAQRHHADLRQPLSGWMGHAAPFAFEDDYAPAPGVSQLLCGTPPILGMRALEVGVDLMARIGMEPLVAKSRALSAFTGKVMAACVPELACISPADPAARGSHLSYVHPHAYELCQALIARRVIGDFRAPDALRLGFAPAYVSFADCWRAVSELRAIIDSGDWRRPEFSTRAAVT